MKTNLESKLVILESQIAEIENNIKNKQIDLKKAEENVNSAKKAKESIDIKDFKYKEVVQKAVQVQELRKVTKQQSSNEIRQNQEAYKAAKLEGEKAIQNAKNIQEQSKKSLEAAAKTSTQTKQARDESEKKYVQTQNSLTAQKQNLVEKNSLLKAKQSDLAKAESAVLSAQTAKNSININNFKYTENVQKPVQVRELRTVTKQQDSIETEYNWNKYNEAQANAKARVQTAKNALDRAEKKVNTWTSILESDRKTRDEATKEVNEAEDSLARVRNRVETEKANVTKEETKKSQIKPEHYPYEVTVERWVSTRKWWESGKWKSFGETRYDGQQGAYNGVIAEAQRRITEAKNELNSWVNYRETAESKLKQAKQKKEAAENEVSSSFRLKNEYESELQSARNELTCAKNNENSINLNNFSYTVVVKKDVEVQEWQMSTKLQTFSEIKYGGKEYDNALTRASTELANAVSHKEACQKEVNAALQSEANSKRSLQVAQEQNAQQEKEVGQRKLEVEKATVLEDGAKKALEKAGQELDNAKKAEQLINIKNFEYTVVVQKNVEVEEMQTVNKLQTFNEVKFGGAEHKKAIEQAEKNFTIAQKNKADCEKELDLLQHEEIKLSSETKVIEQAISTEMEKEKKLKLAAIKNNMFEDLKNIEHNTLDQLMREENLQYESYKMAEYQNYENVN